MSRKLVFEDDHDGSDDSDTEPSPKRQRTAKTRGIEQQAKLQARMTRQDLQIQACNATLEQDEPPSLDDITCMIILIIILRNNFKTIGNLEDIEQYEGLSVLLTEELSSVCGVERSIVINFLLILENSQHGRVQACC